MELLKLPSDSSKYSKLTIEQVRSATEFEQAVEQMQSNVMYVLPENCYYEAIKIDKIYEFNCNQFSYTLYYNYAVSGRTGYHYPMATAELVQNWKTIKGVKKALTGYCKVLFGTKSNFLLFSNPVFKNNEK